MANIEDKEGKLLHLLTQDKWVVDEQTGCWNWGGKLRKGYGRISSWDDGKRVESPAPRVALRSRLGRPIILGMLACHTCDNPACVNPVHLYEGTPKQNTADMMTRQRHNDSFRKGGEATRKLTPSQAQSIRIRAAKGEYYSDLMRDYGVSKQTVSNIVTGKLYGFSGDCRQEKRSALVKRARQGLTKEQVESIVARVQAGITQTSLEDEYGLSRGTVSKIMAGKIYKNESGL